MSPIQIGTYDVADELLGDTEERRPLPGKNTFLVEIDDPFDDEADHALAVEYAGTKVVIYRANGDVVLYHGGWSTRTTLSRINSYGPKNAVTAKYDHNFSTRVDGREPVMWEGYAILIRHDGVIEQLPAFRD